MAQSRPTVKSNPASNGPFPAAKPTEVLRLADDVATTCFTPACQPFLHELIEAAQRLFAGKHPGYQRCDLPYHDFVHACDATNAFLRLVKGHQTNRRPPALTERDFQLGVAAILLHDAGYLKETGDEGGTGAKYTLVHVARGMELVGKVLPPLGVRPAEVQLIQQIIDCTGVDKAPRHFPFANPRHYYLGCAVATADLLGQMASVEYPQRLTALFAEFREAAKSDHSDEPSLGGYASAENLMRLARGFYEQRVRHLLEEEWNGVYRDLGNHSADSQNRYLAAIEFNLTRIDELLEAQSTRKQP